MRSAVLQFLLAGALVVAWIWMLGRPLLAMLARRSRRDSVGHFRYQQAALGHTVDVDRPVGLTSTLLRPFLDWRDQPLGQRRLQVLLAGAMATFTSALLAIALRGVYIRLFLIMTLAFGVHLLIAAWIGARELRAQDAELRRRTIDDATRRAAGRSVTVSRIAAEDRRQDRDLAEDLLAGDGLGGGLFDEGFFEPIPELENGPAHTSPMPAAAEAGESTGRIVEADEATESAEPTFTTAAVARPRPRPGRPSKGRPIYVEPETDEGDETIRAVND